MIIGGAVSLVLGLRRGGPRGKETSCTGLVVRTNSSQERWYSMPWAAAGMRPRWSKMDEYPNGMWFISKEAVPKRVWEWTSPRGQLQEKTERIQVTA